MKVFEKVHIGKCELENRIIRSATFEGMADKKGVPTDDYFSLYRELSKNKIGGIITGYTFLSREGKAMHPGQAGINSEHLVPHFKKITDEVHKNGSKIFIQLAHTGRQTIRKLINDEVVGVSSKKSNYFKEKPRILTPTEIYTIIEKFGMAAGYAKQAGFDGIQIHAAHGYLIHQFILSSINKRKDEFGIDKSRGIGTRFLDLIIDRIRQKCGKDFPILAKISSGVDLKRKFSKKQFVELIKFLSEKKVDAIEISYGTMDYALNIFRGDAPLDLVLSKNPIYKHDNKLSRRLWKSFVFPFMKHKLKPFSPMYNLDYALIAKKYTEVPIISVGGFREKGEIEHAIKSNHIDFVSMCRPFICESDFAVKLMNNVAYESQCKNCNFCAIMCDTQNITRCYQRR